jgi:tetratricopeptide (TPR) repeat protein
MGQSPSTPVQHCERDLELARGQGNKQLEAKAHLDLGNAYKSINQFQKAIPHFKEGLKLAKIRKDKELEKQAYRQLVDVHKSINDVSAAFEYFEKAEALQFRKEEQDIIEKLSTRDSTIFGKVIVIEYLTLKMRYLT